MSKVVGKDGKDGGKDRAAVARPTQIPAARPAVDSRPEQLSEVRFLTVAEVATVMRVSKMTVYRIVHAGELPAVRVGRSFRVPEKAVHDYLQAAFIEAG
jgi:excisionase family DNA binding protein